MSAVLLASLAGSAAAQSANSTMVQVRDHLQRAQSALQANQPEVAVKELRAVLLLDAGNAEAHANLGVLSFVRGDCQDASVHFLEALKVQPSLTKVEALLGICDKRLGNSSAQALLASSFEKLEDVRLRTQVGMELVGLYHRQGKIELMLAVLQKLVELNPDNVDILYTAQRTYSELADDTLNKLAIVAPGSARMQQVIAQALIKAGDLQGAILHYRKALELDSRLPGAHYELAEAILETSPSDAKIQVEAETEIEVATKNDGANSNIECLKGRIAMQRSDFQQAYTHYSRAVVLNPQDAEAQIGLGRVLMTTGRPGEARKCLELVTQLDPLNGEAHYRLANVYRTLQMTEQAEREIRLFHEIKQTKDQVKELYQQMKKQLQSHDDQLDNLQKVPAKDPH